MECENRKNNEKCKGKIKGGVKYANNMRVCGRCFYKLKMENKNK